jgi:hypothetical protein
LLRAEIAGQNGDGILLEPAVRVQSQVVPDVPAETRQRKSPRRLLPAAGLVYPQGDSKDSSETREKREARKTKAHFPATLPSGLDNLLARVRAALPTFPEGARADVLALIDIVDGARDCGDVR